MVNMKRTQCYAWCKKTAKEIMQRRYLSNLKIEIPDEDIIHSLKCEYINKVYKYIEQLTLIERYGYFSESVQKECIYSYAYYLMLCHLIQYKVSDEVVNKIRTRLLAAQYEDGFCYDANLINYLYLNGDGWGMRHFIPHYYVALYSIGCIPKYKFRYLSAFYDKTLIYNFWDSLNWKNAWASSNTFMNIVCTLQFERDFMHNLDVQDAIEASQRWLLDHIRKDCGMWYQGSIKSKSDKLEVIRAAYHLYPVLIYDHVDFPYKEKAIDMILECQNKFGGFDLRKNSSACEDIDAIEPLIRLSLLCPEYKRDEIRLSIRKAFGWNIQNQMADGGCVFRLGEEFNYGHANLSSEVNKSNLFATWFRTLSVCYMYNYLFHEDKIQLFRLPGYEYQLDK